MRTRIVSYVPFGATRGPLPDALEFQVVTPLGELSTASVHYPRQGVKATTLDGVVEVGFEYLNAAGTAWVEAPNCRFLSMKGGFDHLEKVQTRKYDLISVGWMLRGARVWSTSGLPVDADGKVQFVSANAGAIMGTLIANAKGRGWGAGISVDFTSTTTSDGKAWGKIVTIAYDLDLDLDTVLSNLYQQGVCDYRWEGRTLRIFNPDSAMGRDLTLGASPTRLVVADGQTAAPEEWTNEDLLSHLSVIGEGGRRWEFSNPGTGPLGRLEKVTAQGGVTDPGTAALLADPDLIRGNDTRVSYTREFVVTAAMAKAPYLDYLPGDWVQAQRGTGFERLRAMSLSLTVNADGIKGHAVLGDRWEDLLMKLARRTKGISGGASVGGSGVRPAPEGPDVAIPAAPTGLVVAPDAYIDNAGNACGVVNMNWAHSGKNVGGAVMGIDKFNVEYRINELGKPWLLMTSTPDKDAAFSPLNLFKADGVTAEQYGFRVQARGSNGRLSEFSPVTAIVMKTDTTPPPVPYFAAGDVTTWLRTVTVRWRGKGTTTGANQVSMPRDFDHINVYQAAAADMGGRVLVGQIRDVSIWQSGSMALTTVYYALTAVDRSGNESALSTSRAITPTARVDVQEIIDKIDAAEVALTNVGESSILTGAVIARHITASESMTAKMAEFLHVKVGQLDVNDIWADSAWIGAAQVGVLTANSVVASMIKGDAINGKTIIGANIKTSDTAGPGVGAGVVFDSSGISGFNPRGDMMFRLSSSTGSIDSFGGGSITGATIQTNQGDGYGIKMTPYDLTGYDSETPGKVMFQLTSSGYFEATNAYLRGGVMTGGTFVSSSFGGNRLWMGADMRSSGAPSASARPGIVFNADAAELAPAAIYRDGTWGAVMIDSPYSNTGSYSGQSTISVSNHGIEMWASKQGALTGPTIASSAMLALNAPTDWFIGGGGTANQEDGRIKWVGGEMSVRRGVSHVLTLKADRSTSLNTSRLDITGPLYATAKNFKIPHPTKPGMDLYHGSTESPLAGIEYWGAGTIRPDGTAPVDLPDYFESLAKARNRTVYAAGNGAPVSWTVIKDGRFTVTGPPGTVFSWLVKAERFAADFDVEQPTQPLEGEIIHEP